jgi:hypothetical protein
MNVWWQIAIGIGVLWLVLRFVLSLVSSRIPAESVDPLIEGPRDPSAGVPSPKKRGPRNRSGAIALAEPDEEDGNQSFPPRQL